MGPPLQCYGVYSFPRTVTGVKRGRDGQGRLWSSPSGHGELSWLPALSLSRARTAVLLVASLFFVLMLCLAQISPPAAGWPMTRD